MSGPVGPRDAPPSVPDTGPEGPVLEVTPARASRVGAVQVRRALPRRDRRTVGAWCFADHMGPHRLEDGGVDIGPHPHIGLQTATWLVSGELLHRDSLGGEQPIRPGQLNLMTAGRGVSHAEESTGAANGRLAGIQLWIAQPEATRHGDPAFEHHRELPGVTLDGADATVLVGGLDVVTSPARTDSELVGAELRMRPGATALALRPDFEHALVVLEGSLSVGGHPDERIGPGMLAYLGSGRDELGLAATQRCRTMLLGGVPFETRILMWWNFVARERAEIDEATADWTAGSGRFGETGSGLPRFAAPPTPW